MNENTIPRLTLTYRHAAQALGVHKDTVEAMVARGELEQVWLTERLRGVTWRSLVAKVHGVEAA